MRSDGFVAAMLIGLVFATACGSLPGRLAHTSSTASSTRVASPFLVTRVRFKAFKPVRHTVRCYSQRALP